jgi:glycosyltransferase involved in cell wall biosynthesis
MDDRRSDLPLPLVTVVIPAFNRERFLGDAIESVFLQDHRPLEVLVVDDGSTDGTAAVARRFPGVRYLGRSHGGAAAARNTGVTAARGEFLAFLDSDDLWLKEKLACQIEAMVASPDPAMAFGWVQQFVSPDATGPVRDRIVCPEKPRPGRTCGTLLLRREVMERVGPFDESLAAGEFVDWLSRARLLGIRDVMVERVVLRRRLHGGNLGYQNPALRQDLVRAVGNHLRRQREARGES